jgi:hypothetical protein
LLGQILSVFFVPGQVPQKPKDCLIVLNDELLSSRFVAAQNSLHQPFVLPVSHRPRLPSTLFRAIVKANGSNWGERKNLASVVNHAHQRNHLVREGKFRQIGLQLSL